MQTSARALTRHADPQLLSLRFSNLHHARFSTKRTSSQASLTLKDLGERLSLLARFGATAYVIQVYVINTTMVSPAVLHSSHRC